MEKGRQDAFDKARLQVIQDAYERAFECINAGLSQDEAGHGSHALELYRTGRRHLLRGVSVPSAGEECVGTAWDAARQMQQKMQETLGNITTRLAVLETGTSSAHPTLAPPPSGLPREQPPAYSPQAADGHVSISYGTDAGEMSLVGDDFYSRVPAAPPPPVQALGEEGEELFYLPHGVQVFFVSPDGQVSAPSYPGYLRIVKFTGEPPPGAPYRPPAFLQVCDWLYPLMCRDSPVLLCNTGVFMFPDAMAPMPGSYVGVVLSSELPASERETFQDLLSQLTDLRVQAPAETADTINLGQKVPVVLPEVTPAGAVVPAEGEEKALPEWSEKVAHGILTGASWLSWGLVKGAEYTGKAIHKGASKLREHITPEDKPSTVSPNVSRGLHVAKQATGGAVRVSQFLVDGVCKVANCVGREVAPHLKKHGGKLIPESLKKDKEGRSNVDGAMVVAASGVQGFATMWTGLEVAAKNIAKSVASETVSTVKHKYGAAAGQATDHAVNSAINVGITAFNIDNLGIKAVVKRTGKQTAQALLEEYKLQETSEKGCEGTSVEDSK